MKKNLMTLAAILCCAMTMTLFTACGDDDDEGGKKPVVEATSGVMECQLYSSDRTLDSFDFYVKYYDDEGNIKSEKVVWSEQNNSDGLRTWSKKVVQKLPSTLGISLEIKAKDGIDLNGQYWIDRGYDVTFTSRTASGDVIDLHPIVGHFESSHNKAGMLEDWLQESGRPLNVIYKYDINGKTSGTGKLE